MATGTPGQAQMDTGHVRGTAQLWRWGEGRGNGEICLSRSETQNFVF